MPTYKQKVRFTREFTLEASNASEATAKLEEEVDRVEWDADVRSEGIYPFEDEDVRCPHCNGEGSLLDDADVAFCHTCDGNGYVPFETAELLAKNKPVLPSPTPEAGETV